MARHRLKSLRETIIARMPISGGKLQRLSKATEGSVLVEVAFSMILMVVVLMAVVEVAMGYYTYRKFEMTARGVMDAVAGVPEYCGEVRAAIPKMTNLMMTPVSGTPLSIEFVSLLKKTGGVYEVLWRHVPLGSDPTMDYNTILSTVNNVPDESVLVMNANYKYKPVFFQSFVGEFTFKQQFIRNPYNSKRIYWSDQYAFQRNNFVWR